VEAGHRLRTDMGMKEGHLDDKTIDVERKGYIL